MAHKAADGSMWTNASQARKVPGKKQGDGKQPVSHFSKPAPESESSENGSTEQEPSQVVAEHGPAKKVTIYHDSASHGVSSEHPDGHKHDSKHASAEEAHAAAGTLAGVTPADSMPVESNPSQAMM